MFLAWVTFWSCELKMVKERSTAARQKVAETQEQALPIFRERKVLCTFFALRVKNVLNGGAAVWAVGTELVCGPQLTHEAARMDD
jgi:hypothetical protein